MSSKIGFKYLRVRKLVRIIGLGEEILSRKIVATNTRNLKVNIRKLVPVKNTELENWWENVCCSKKCKSEN